MRFEKNILIIFSLVFLFIVDGSEAQTIRVNELMSSNAQTIIDEDGDTPDWFELYNYGEEDIDLEGFSVTDKSNTESWWTFPSYNLSAGQHLLVFASDKNRQDAPLIYNTVIDVGDEWRYILPNQEPDASWRETGFDDFAWEVGKTGIGYGDGDDSTIVERTISVFMRKTFDIADVSQVKEMYFHVDFDDGFIAYINGKEIARSGLQGDFPSFDAQSELHEATMYNGGNPEAFLIDHASEFLVEGENVLCIQVHNANNTSSDMTMIPFLSLGSATGEVGLLSDYLSFSTKHFHTDFKLSSDGDSVFLRNPEQVIFDTLISGEMAADVSWGWTTGDGSSLAFLEDATPGELNSEDGFENISGEVEFSIEGGIYQTSVSLELSTENQMGTIYYTLDGSAPDAASIIYTDALTISQSTVVRARVLDDQSLPGLISSGSYLIGVDHDIAVVSLTVDPYDFFDDMHGMYQWGPNASNDFPHFGANFWEDWERPVNVELFEPNGELAFNARAGAKIFGGWSRGNPQKSLSLFFRQSYGDGPIDYQVFEDKDLDEFSSLVLRNSGNDWNRSMMRDGLLNDLFHESVDKQAFRPAALYINGEYWGIQNIREKVNEHFLANNHDVDPNNIELLETEIQPIHGNEEHYRAMIDFVANNDMSSNANYEYVSTLMDIDNFIYYQTANIFINNTDWPGNNIKYWRENSETGKWRWITYDKDFGFGIWNVNDMYNNTLAFAADPFGPDWPNPPWSTLLLRRLLENETFTTRFINLFADQLNTTWLTANIDAAITEKSDAIADEIRSHMSRWGGSMGTWEESVANMHEFANVRRGEVFGHIREQFDISGTFSLTIQTSNASHGEVRVNTIKPPTYPWTGRYFDNIAVELEAIPKPGHAFVRWEGVSLTGTTIQLNASTSLTVSAIFEETAQEINQVVINEINYKSGSVQQIDDWVELYNKGESQVNLSGWVLKDDDDSHEFVFPDGAILPGNGFLVVCRNRSNFEETYGNSVSLIGEMGFGLSGSGDCVRLFDPSGELAEEVCYESSDPWPDLDETNGASMALRHPTYDNQNPVNWYALETNGNPGEANIRLVNALTEPSLDSRLVAYPNPFVDELWVEIMADQSGEVHVQVQDLQGRIHGNSDYILSRTGKQRLKMPEVVSLPKGMYILTFTSASWRDITVVQKQ